MWAISFLYKPDQTAASLTPVAVEAHKQTVSLKFFSVSSAICILLLEPVYCSSPFLVTF